MWRKFVGFADRHAWVVTLAGVAFMLLVTVAAVQHESRTRDKKIAAALADANQQVCANAVTAVVAQLNADLLRTLNVIEDRFTDTARPVPGIYLELERSLTNRTAPTGACKPKKEP